MTSLAPLGGGLVARAPGAAAKTVAGMVEGAGIGSVYGSGAADGGNRLGGAAEGAVGGAIAGGLMARAGVSFQRYLDKRALTEGGAVCQRSQGDVSGSV